MTCLPFLPERFPQGVPMERKGSWTAQTRNPVSVRLYKVLSNNFEDDATKEALDTLSKLYVTVGNPRPGSVLSETVPGESAARARKSLRRDMESKLAEGCHQFLKAFGEVDEVGSFVICASPLLRLTLATGRNWMTCTEILMPCDKAVTRRRLTWF